MISSDLNDGKEEEKFYFQGTCIFLPDIAIDNIGNG